MSEQIVSESKYYILLSIATPRHGYAIMQNILELTGGRIEMGAGTLYGALKNLVKDGFAEPLTGALQDRKREYRLTNQGRELLRSELGRYRELVKNGTEILEEQA